MRYSSGGSLAWELIYVLLGLAIFDLISGVFADGEKVNTARVVSTAAGAILIFTLGALPLLLSIVSAALATVLLVLAKEISASD